MQKIRLRYAGFVAFFANIFGIFTGLAFTVFIARKLSPGELGLWTLLYSFVGYFVFPANIASFWTTRYQARGISSARTGMCVNAILCGVMLAVYFTGAFGLSVSVPDASFPLMLFAAALIPPMYAVITLNSVAGAVKPEATYQGNVVFEILKVILGFMVIVELRTGVWGAIAVLVVSYSALSFIICYLIRRDLGGRFDKGLAARIIRHFWLPAYDRVGPTLLTLDILVGSLVLGTLPVAYYQIPYTICMAVGYSGSLAVALYPRLMGGGGERDVEESLDLVLMFGVPMFFGVLFLARPVLSLFNPVYVDAWQSILPLSFAFLLASISTVYDAVLRGMEKVELKSEATFRDFLKSSLFLSSSLSLMQASVYLPLLGVTLALFTMPGNSDPVWLSLLWSGVNLVSSIPFVALRWFYSRRLLTPVFPTRRLLKYIAASVAMVAVLSPFWSREPPTTFAPALGQVLAQSGLGAAAYLGLLYSVDRKFRKLVESVLAGLHLR